jgi:hypothetical protein
MYELPWELYSMILSCCFKVATPEEIFNIALVWKGFHQICDSHLIKFWLLELEGNWETERRIPPGHKSVWTLNQPHDHPLHLVEVVAFA